MGSVATAVLTPKAIFANCAGLWPKSGPQPAESSLSRQAASNALLAAQPSRLVFTWDNPSRPNRTSLAELGGFFLASAGRPIRVDGVELASGDDPNLLLLRRAATPGSAILWVYDLGVGGTSAIEFPPRIDELAPRWGCRRFGDHRMQIVACDRDWAISTN